MQENFIVPRRTGEEIKALAFDWRHTFGIQDQWAVDLIGVFNQLTERLPGFELVRQSDELLGHADAFTRHPRIFVRETVYQGVLNWDGRKRFTLAHELGHLLMHPETPLPRIALGNRPAPVDEYNRSAEWQANKFATYFLMPDHIVRQFASPAELAEHCKVSSPTAGYRFKEVGHFKEPLTETFLAFLEDWKRKYT
jgi:hypothetical protein